MFKASAQVPTRSGWKYVQQLGKHWSHKLAVELHEPQAVVRFSSALATMRSDQERITTLIEAEDQETLVRMQRVVQEHLDRFAFREAPLAFPWSMID